MNGRDAAARTAAWREPMVWLVALIPLSAVAGTLWMVVAARAAPGTDDAVADPVRRTAQVQLADLGPDARADALQLRAQVRRVRVGGREVLEVLPLGGAFPARRTLSLALRHPARAQDDRILALAPAAHGWRTTATVDLRHGWNLQLADGTAWRLQGRWAPGQPAAMLAPAWREAAPTDAGP